nr:ribonuclease H-like domain-containing protein [Tanacetum cinerariifolium]
MHMVPTTVITKSKLVPINTARPVTAVAPKPHVTRPRPTKPIVTKTHSPPRRHINQSPSPKASNFPPKVTAVKVLQGNPQYALKDKGVIDIRCSRSAMDSESIAGLWIPILNPNEFDLWKIRIKQYFLMTDYSLWKVILNGDSTAPIRVIEGVVQPVAPTTTE